MMNFSNIYSWTQIQTIKTYTEWIKGDVIRAFEFNTILTQKGKSRNDKV